MSEVIRVIGIDPGSRFTGFGVVESEGSRLYHIDSGRVVLRPDWSLADRLKKIFDELTSVIANHRPTAASVETVFASRNAQSALILGHARGVALLCVATFGLELAEFTPGQIKRSVVGSGRADKHQVQQMVQMLLGLDTLVSEDASDALAAAICRCQHRALPVVPEPVASRTKGVSKRLRGRAALEAAYLKAKGKK